MSKNVVHEKSDFGVEIYTPDIKHSLPKYFGVVVSVHEGYSYIGHVKRGSETIATNGDVFVPIAFDPDDMVEFDELNEDPKRKGKYRTEEARLTTGLVVRNGRSIPEIVSSLNENKSHYHINGKVIDVVDVKKAGANKPFVNLVHKKINGVCDSSDIVELSKMFLRSTFASIESYGVDYSITEEINLVDEQVKISNGIEKAKSLGLEGMTESIKTEYEKFVAVRESFNIMHKAGILKIESIIPIEYLPDLFVVAPVWFVHSKESLVDNIDHNDPKVDHAVRYFCDLVGSEEFAWLFQIYNRRTRHFKYFESRDVMPLSIMEIFEHAKNTFDYLTICTPYHDIASDEWSDPNWMRNIDPYLVGFMKDVPFMFLLGRWSATGLFPMMLDMIADTMNHLRVNTKLLRNFPTNTYWHRGKKSSNNNNANNYHLLENSATDTKNSVLEPFALEVLEAYEQGTLFEFLKGRKPLILKEE